VKYWQIILLSSVTISCSLLHVSSGPQADPLEKPQTSRPATSEQKSETSDDSQGNPALGRIVKSIQDKWGNARYVRFSADLTLKNGAIPKSPISYDVAANDSGDVRVDVYDDSEPVFVLQIFRVADENEPGKSKRMIRETDVQNNKSYEIYATENVTKNLTYAPVILRDKSQVLCGTGFFLQSFVGKDGRMLQTYLANIRKSNTTPVEDRSDGTVTLVDRRPERVSLDRQEMYTFKRSDWALLRWQLRLVSDPTIIHNELVFSQTEFPSTIDSKLFTDVPITASLHRRLSKRGLLHWRIPLNTTSFRQHLLDYVLSGYDHLHAPTME
jgi:hypothetical protein